MFSVLVAILATLLSIYAWLHLTHEAQLRSKANVAPGPRPWPVIGSLHLMANFEKYPFEVFTKLQKVSSTFNDIPNPNNNRHPDLWIRFRNETWTIQLRRGEF